MILWIANPLCDDTACWHAALRVLRAEAAQLMRCFFKGFFEQELYTYYNLPYHTRWWFQIFFIFTPKIGEDSQFD